jgi:hypothetical protein
MVEVGGANECGITTGRLAVWCRGSNTSGQLATGDKLPTAGPLWIAQSPQTLSTSTLPAPEYIDATFSILGAAVTTSDLSQQVTYAVAVGETDCSVTDTTVTINASGECSLVASQAGDGLYLAATPLAFSVTVSTSVLTASIIADDRNYTAGNTDATATCSVSGAREGDDVGCDEGSPVFSSDQAGEHLVSTTVSLTGTKASNYTLSSTAASDWATILVINDSIEITNDPAPYTIIYGTTIDLNSTSGSGTGALAWSVAGLNGATCSVDETTGEVSVTNTNFGTGSCLVTVTKTADNNYYEATDSVELLTVAAAQSGLSIDQSVGNLTYGSTLDLDATGGSGEGSITWSVVDTTASCSIDPASGVLSVDNANGGTTTCTVMATKAADTNYESTSDEFAVTIELAGDSITIDPTLDDAILHFTEERTMSLSVEGLGQGGIVWSVVDTTATCTIDASGVLSVDSAANGTEEAPTSCTVTVTKSADDNYNGTDDTITINIARVDQANDFTIYTDALADTATYTPAPGTSVALSSSGGSAGDVTYSVATDESDCFIAGSALTVMNVGDGECVITGTRAATSNYNAISTTVTLYILPATPTLSFTGESDSIGTFNYGPLSVTAESSSGDEYTITYDTWTPSICSVDPSSGSVTINGAGLCTITANSIGTENYYAAAEVEHEIVIDKDAQDPLTVTGGTTLTYGSTLDLDTTGGSGEGSIEWSIVPNSGCSIDASGLLTTTDANFGGTDCTVAATKSEDDNYYDTTSVDFVVTISRATDSITIDPTLADTDLLFSDTRVMSLSDGGAGTGAIT